MWLIYLHKNLQVHGFSSEPSRVRVVKAANFDCANSAFYDAIRLGPVQCRMARWLLASGKFQRKRRDPNGNSIPAFCCRPEVIKNLSGYFEIWRGILPNTKFYAFSSVKLGNSFFRHVAANHWATGSWSFKTTWRSHLQGSRVQKGIKSLWRNIHHWTFDTWRCYHYTNSEEQSPSREANKSPSNQEIPRILCNPNVHYRIHNSPSTAPVLSQLNPLMDPHPTSLRSTLILSSNLRLDLPRMWPICCLGSPDTNH
jgi:hypothetical protein